MPTYLQDPIKIEFTITEPFWLSLGRNRSLITDRAVFVHERQYLKHVGEESDFDVWLSPMPVRETYSLFIGGKLYSVTRPTGTRRPSVKITYPVTRKGETPPKTKNRISIQLVKKYTTLAH